MRNHISAYVLALFYIFTPPMAWSTDKDHKTTGDQGAQSSATAEETLTKLTLANKYFSEGRVTLRNIPARRADLVKGQTPSTVVLSCSDSRVPPELIFNQGLGDIFVVRVAGNVADPVALGSIEYAVEHLNVPLVIVMGHDKCGAVAATVKGGVPEGNIRTIVNRINPAVQKAKTTGKTGDDLLDAAILENVRSVTAGLTRDSSVIRHLVETKKLKIVPAKYSLATGKVDWL